MKKANFAQKTLRYAKRELEKYCLAVTGEKPQIELCCETTENTFDDGYLISVKKGIGTITGKNPRSVLLGVYGYFYELGCRFIRPGKDGDLLVKKNKKRCNVTKRFVPAYRHRGVCSEGAISEENVTDMIRWLPKIGMNSYFIQFRDGHLFFEKWYRHKGSSVLAPEEYSVTMSEKHYAAAVDAIEECGLEFHAVGHGWTTEPFGYVTYGETAAKEEDILPEHRKFFAEVNGKRGFFSSPGDTQLCYGNPEVREKITDAVKEYLRAHPEVDALHFWLADGMNNHCECALCRDTLPSDFYVEMLNLLDEKLTKAGIDTKIVFLVYCDLLFAPRKERFHNPDRFILMYAPIGRNFFRPLYTKGFSEKCDPPEYVRNRNRHPKTNGEYLYYLKGWLDTVRCDSFAFDYHLMTFPYGGDLSGIRIARTLYQDMGSLKKVGLNGNVSCQLQRIFLPSGLPMYVMAKRLCGEGRSFRKTENEYFSAAFGRQSSAVKRLLHETEKFFVSEEMTTCCTGKKREKAICLFARKFSRTKEKIFFGDADPAIGLGLDILKFFTEIIGKLLKILERKDNGEEYLAEKEAFFRFLDEKERMYQPYLDVLFLKEGVNAWI